MDISGVSSGLIQTATNAPAGDQQAILVLKLANDIAAQSAQELIEAIPNLGSRLGQNIDTYV